MCALPFNSCQYANVTPVTAITTEAEDLSIGTQVGGDMVNMSSDMQPDREVLTTPISEEMENEA